MWLPLYCMHVSAVHGYQQGAPLQFMGTRKGHPYNGIHLFSCYLNSIGYTDRNMNSQAGETVKELGTSEVKASASPKYLHIFRLF